MKTREMRRYIPTLTIGPILAALVAAPIFVILWTAFKPTGFVRDPGFTLQNFREVYGDPELLGILTNTVVFAAGSTLCTILIALPIAWLIERTDLPASGLFRGLVILPMATPALLLAIAWTMLLNPTTGVFNDFLGSLPGGINLNIYSLWGMIFVEALASVPTAFLIIAPALRSTDPSLEEAAQMCGANLGTILRRVTIPLAMPAILAAATFLMIAGFVVFDVPGILGLPGNEHVLSTNIYRLAKRSPTGLPLYGQIGALVVLVLLVLAVLAWSYRRATRHSSKFATLTGKGYRPRRLPLGRWKYAAVCVITGYFTLAVVAPLGILLWTSLSPYMSRPSLEMVSNLTLNSYHEVFTNPRIVDAVQNTLVIALVSAVAVTVLAPLISWVVVKSDAPGRRAIDFFSFAPLALVGVMIGAALTTLYLAVPIPVYGTIWIIVIAYVTIYLAFGTRVTHGVMHQLHPDLEEAAQTSGASWARTFGSVTIPLVSPALIGVFIWVATHAMRELSAAMMLQGRDNAVVSTLLFNYWDTGRAPLAAAIAVCLMASLALLVTIWQLVGGRFGITEKE